MLCYICIQINVLYPFTGSIAKSKPQPKCRTKYKKDDMEYQASTVDDDELIQEYEINSYHPCLVCRNFCMVKKGRKLPHLPFCKRCKKAFFFQRSNWNPSKDVRHCEKGGKNFFLKFHHFI